LSPYPIDAPQIDHASQKEWCCYDEPARKKLRSLRTK
jgi:hypothetical protein